MKVKDGDGKEVMDGDGKSGARRTGVARLGEEGPAASLGVGRVEETSLGDTCADTACPDSGRAEAALSGWWECRRDTCRAKMQPGKEATEQRAHEFWRFYAHRTDKPSSD